ncbi:DUF305 domain-containing protein [Bosea sp. (in: a-proteobacteria)]|jgi:uncharacterized protein (DUF305 family)|uniref:DUF305 domain-containing protein n=1 Tax=Bosea sp. (in: a-proteobacteria) TaxID=1871050 RepID=UPI002736FB2C|nr:DUF305 domain-containing protein [Bosea sp. (in: a-proteobacteria)]MDP3257480.1 DUF305 domain-containing protein [Bosea sp. (in: a-proteobacteria)]
MTRLGFIGLSSALAITAAIAQQPAPKPAMDPAMHMKMMQPAASDSASTKGYKESMMGMMQAMPMTFTGDADIDFMMQMKGHHQGAIAMAKVELANGKDAEAKKLAMEIVAAQEKEIAVIDQWLKAKGK